MKDCIGTYNYKGFSINFHEMYQIWTLEPNYLNLEDNDILNFTIEYNNSFSPEFKTIASAKKYIRENEKELKEDIQRQLEEYLKTV